MKGLDIFQTHKPVERFDRKIDVLRYGGLHRRLIERTAMRLYYTFRLHQHPYVTRLTREFIDRRVPGLQEMDTADPPLEHEFFKAMYAPAKAAEEFDPLPNSGAFVDSDYPRYELDFKHGSPYAVYNHEIFFHIPLAIAMHLSRNQRFAEAREWLHYIFDPTDATDEPEPQRYWKFKPFKSTQVEQLVNILTNLSTRDDPALLQDTMNAIDAWRDAPFSPHVVARARPSMYMEKTIMVYMDNMIAWGDSLFQQDSTEAIDEAASYYFIVAKLLGKRPEQVPMPGSVKPQNYQSIRANLDKFSNVLEDTEADIIFDVVPPPTTEATVTDRSPAIDSLGRTLYFCVPHNEKLLEYWDTIADRLFKIRNSLNIRGVFRELPLFDPPIDPAMLARAAAAGVDIASVIAGFNQPLSSLRFTFLVQKAMSLCQEAKSLAAQLLATLEKEDNEVLAQMRARHERQMLELTEAVKYGQLQEATKQLEALQRSLEGAMGRYVYYERLLGRKESEIKLPEFAALDTEGLLNLKLKSTEKMLDVRPIDVDIAQNAAAVAAGKLVSRHEAQELIRSAEARNLQLASSVLDLLGGVLGLIPQFAAYGSPMGVGAGADFGGTQLAQMTRFMSSAVRIGADIAAGDAALAGKIGGFARREQDWTYQSNNVAIEIGQIFKQLRAAEIRQALAEREWQNHKKQIENSKEIDTFLTDERKGKQANRALYSWMRRELRTLYTQAFDFAFEVARKAQRALQHELGPAARNYLSPTYTTGKEKLLAGERLFADLQRMEFEYHENNPATLKPLVHVSLSEIDPLALLQLRATGRCKLSIPESFLDRTGPGEWFRQIRSVAVTVPCVVGPYVGVHCKLTLLNSAIRKSAALAATGYARESAADARFEDYRGLVQSIVVSSGASDAGTIDADDAGIRRAPFEHHGVISEWELQLPANPSANEPTAFDYDTITDVVLSIRYSARDGGERLRAAAMKSLMDMLKEANAAGAGRLFSIRHDFPDQWAKLTKTKATAAAPAELSLDLDERHYPYWAHRDFDKKKVTRSLLLASGESQFDVRDPASSAGKDDLSVKIFGKDSSQIQAATLNNNPLKSLKGKQSWLLTDNSMSDLWLFVGWNGWED